jgi:hypothetical protein
MFKKISLLAKFYRQTQDMLEHQLGSSGSFDLGGPWTIVDKTHKDVFHVTIYVTKGRTTHVNTNLTIDRSNSIKHNRILYICILHHRFTMSVNDNYQAKYREL